MRKALRTIARALHRAWDVFPLTLGGLLVASLGGVARFYLSVESQDLVLHTTGTVALAVVGADVAVVLIGAAVLAVAARRERAPLLDRSVDVGIEVRTGLRIPRFSAWPFIDVALSWGDPSRATVRLSDDGRRFEERVTLHERGRHRSVTRRFAVRDIFGLAEVAFRVRRDAALRVAPAQTPADLSTALRTLSGDGYSHPAGEPVGEMVEMRQYAPGDALRFVLWKTYARSRRMLVRTPERAIVHTRSTVAYLVAGASDEPSASAARVFVERLSGNGGLVFAADGAERHATEAPAAVDAIIDSARFRRSGGEGLGRLLRHLDRAQLASCFVFVPARRGPWLDNLRGFARELPAPPTVVVAVDGSLSGDGGGKLGRLLTAGDGVPRQVKRLPWLYDDLKALGGPVHVLHHPSGRPITEHDIDALRSR